VSTAPTTKSVLELAESGEFDAVTSLPPFVDFVLNTYGLRHVSPQRIENGPMKLAFWLNVYNTLVRACWCRASKGM